jgi:hypothetical protein
MKEANTKLPEPPNHMKCVICGKPKESVAPFYMNIAPWSGLCVDCINLIINRRPSENGRRAA